MIENIVSNPVKVSVGVVLVIMFGVIAIYTMPVQLTPEVQIPTLTIETRWPGASPEEVEREIVQEQEEQLQKLWHAVQEITQKHPGPAELQHEGYTFVQILPVPPHQRAPTHSSRLCHLICIPVYSL